MVLRPKGEDALKQHQPCPADGYKGFKGFLKDRRGIERYAKIIERHNSREGLAGQGSSVRSHRSRQPRGDLSAQSAVSKRRRFKKQSTQMVTSVSPGITQDQTQA